MEVLTDPKLCRTVTDQYPDYFTFDAEDWFSNPDNYALKEGENIGFAEPKDNGVYWVHFCFHTARGKQALDLTKRLLINLFENKPAKIAIGIISKENKKALWVVRVVGFTSLGEVETKNGLCEMFYFIKENI